jgi:hypothetical protein
VSSIVEKLAQSLSHVRMNVSAQKRSSSGKSKPEISHVFECAHRIYGVPLVTLNHTLEFESDARTTGPLAKEILLQILHRHRAENRRRVRSRPLATRDHRRLTILAPYRRRCRSRMASYARLESRRRDFHRSLRKLPDRQDDSENKDRVH